MGKLYKSLDKDGKGPYSGMAWSLPREEPGDWMPPVEGKLEVCLNGYHLCARDQLVEWIDARVFEAEYRGERLDEGDKIVVREARLLREITVWDERTQQLFACDRAEHALPYTEMKYPNNIWPRQALEVARRHANGEITEKELDAALDGARASERQWKTERLFEYLDGTIV